MAEEEVKKVEGEAPPAEAAEAAGAPKDVTEEKALVPSPLPPAEEKPDDSKALVVVESSKFD